MINEKYLKLGTNRSTIRELFEFGKKLSSEIGSENVFDYSLGNPSVAPPLCVNEGIEKLIREYDGTKLHAYTSAEGDIDVRKNIAHYIRDTFGAEAEAENVYMTAGAAAALSAALGAIVTEGEEVITPVPYFPEYRVFAEEAGGRLVTVSAKDGGFGLDTEALGEAIGKACAAVIINSPNNPSGKVYTEAEIKALADLLKKKSKEAGHPIYIIADEPYRELVYDGVNVPYIPNYYDNTIVCYSFSKSLSIPGERIGYVFVSPKSENAKEVFRAVCGAGRSLGYVCAPSLLQRLVSDCLGKSADIDIYDSNRKMLLEALTSYGYETEKPEGAFYLFVRSLCPDAKEFSERAKKYGLLLVPGDDFGAPGYVRIAYCQDPKMVERSLGAFKKLSDEFRA